MVVYTIHLLVLYVSAADAECVYQTCDALDLNPVKIWTSYIPLTKYSRIVLLVFSRSCQKVKNEKIGGRMIGSEDSQLVAEIQRDKGLQCAWGLFVSIKIDTK